MTICRQWTGTQIRYRCRAYGPDSWRTTEKSDIDAGCIDRTVGGQQKNQLLGDMAIVATISQSFMINACIAKYYIIEG